MTGRLGQGGHRGNAKLRPFLVAPSRAGLPLPQEGTIRTPFNLAIPIADLAVARAGVFAL